MSEPAWSRDMQARASERLRREDMPDQVASAGEWARNPARASDLERRGSVLATAYRTIVADPPWHYDPLPIGRTPQGVTHDGRTTPLPFGSMTVAEIAALPVERFAADDAHLYLWTTNRYLRPAFDVLAAWGFRYSQTLAWCKKPMGLGPGATFANTLEFVLVGKRGSLAPLRRWNTAWLQMPRTSVHSKKPDAFLDIVEQVSPGPYLELFARRARFGWDYWGDESLSTVEMPA